MNLCRFLGHKPTMMRLKEHEYGFACWRCGIRFGWDGNDKFSVLHELEDNKNWIVERMSKEALLLNKTYPLKRTKNGYFMTMNPDKLEVSLMPIKPPKWAKNPKSEGRDD